MQMIGFSAAQSTKAEARGPISLHGLVPIYSETAFSMMQLSRQ